MWDWGPGRRSLKPGAESCTDILSLVVVCDKGGASNGLIPGALTRSGWRESKLKSAMIAFRLVRFGLMPAAAHARTKRGAVGHVSRGPVSREPGGDDAKL